MAIAADVDSGVRDVLDRWMRAYEAKNTNGVMEVFASDDDLQLVGTGADEVRLSRAEVRAQIERDFAQADQLSVELAAPRISSAGDLAWVFAPCSIHVVTGGGESTMNARLTAVLQRGGGTWRVRQAHLSMPMAEQAEGQSYPTVSS